MGREFIKRRKIIVAGFIDLNALDGSAFFLSGVTAMMAGEPGLSLTLVSATRVHNYTVISELQKYPNVSLIDPFETDDLVGEFKLLGRSSMTRGEYARVVASIADGLQPDAILFRDTLAAADFCEFSRFAGITSVYVTGISDLRTVPEDEILASLRQIVNSESRLIVQTEQMEKRLIQLMPDGKDSAIFVLPPHVPDSPGGFDELRSTQPSHRTIVYTGKFFPDWNIDKLIAGFKAVRRAQDGELSMVVVGNHFREDPDDPLFVKNTKYLLSNTEGLTWVPGATRNVSRGHICESSVGLSWRRSSLNSSTEFSTKVLEYGSMARPVILNRTEAHEEALGYDYPLFVDSMADYKATLTRMWDSPSLMENAAQRCYDLASLHSYSRQRQRLINFLLQPARRNSGTTYLQVENPDLRSSVAFAKNSTVQGGLDGNLLAVERVEGGVPLEYLLEWVEFVKGAWSDLIVEGEQGEGIVGLASAQGDIGNNRDSADVDAALLNRAMNLSKLENRVVKVLHRLERKSLVGRMVRQSKPALKKLYKTVLS